MRERLDHPTPTSSPAELGHLATPGSESEKSRWERKRDQMGSATSRSPSYEAGGLTYSIISSNLGSISTRELGWHLPAEDIEST